MRAHRVLGLSLKKTKLGESDLIVTFLAEDGSQVRAVAKGARKPGSRFGARVEPFSVVDMVLHTGRTLETITEAETVRPHSGLREDYDRSQAASVVADFLDKVSLEGQSEERLFGLAVATLDAMEGASGDGILALVVAFLLKGMSMHGYRPQFEGCASCGSPVGGGGSFSLESGGLLCEGCSADGPGMTYLSPDVERALRLLMAARMADVPGLEIPRPVLAAAFELLRAFVVYHVPARLKALAMYAADLARTR